RRGTTPIHLVLFGLRTGTDNIRDYAGLYTLRTWLPSVYRGHDNWHTRGFYGRSATPGCLALHPPEICFNRNHTGVD
ncbi:hypothetical protein HN51_016396, partial [Arachis hypogaea]